MPLTLALAALLGAILGSFLNALSFRFNTGRSMGGRSRCMHCRHTLGVLDLVPIFSYLFLQGQCRYCGARISLQYPLVEGAAALLALLLYLLHGVSFAFFFWLVVWMILLFIVIYDIRHAIIPWAFSISLAFLAFVSLFIFYTPNMWMLLAGPILALPLFLFSLVSRGRWMGWGDSLLELSLGWILGLSMGASALMLAFWSGAVVGIMLILSARWQPSETRFTIKSEIPFAPFLVLGAFVTYFFHVDFFSSVSLLW